MAEQREEWDARRNADETRHPDNPPNSVLSSGARNAALVSYLGPLVVLFLIVGLGLMYWAGRSGTAQPKPAAHDQAVGTAGNTTPGGGDPQPRPGSTRDELEQRGGVHDATSGPMPALHDRTSLTSIDQILRKPNDVVGRPVDLDKVTVDSAQGNAFWVRDGDDKVEVIAPDATAAPQKGSHVHVIGTVERSGNATRVRASKIENR